MYLRSVRRINPGPVASEGCGADGGEVAALGVDDPSDVSCAEHRQIRAGVHDELGVVSEGKACDINRRSCVEYYRVEPVRHGYKEVQDSHIRRAPSGVRIPVVGIAPVVGGSFIVPHNRHIYRVNTTRRGQ